MSNRFHKRRRIAREEKRERMERLERGFKKIGESTRKWVDIIKQVVSDHPEYEELTEEERSKILINYIKR
jgi:hypothetical protein